MSESLLKSWLRKNLQTVLLVVLFPLVTYAGSVLFREIGKYLSDQISKTALWSLLGMLIALCAFLVLLLYLQRNPFKKAYGLLWDKRLNPHCPICEKQINMPKHDKDLGTDCYCPNCDAKIYPTRRDGVEFESVAQFWNAISDETGWDLGPKESGF